MVKASNGETDAQSRVICSTTIESDLLQRADVEGTARHVRRTPAFAPRHFAVIKASIMMTGPRMNRLLLTILLLLGSWSVVAARVVDPRVGDLVQSGKLRAALFMPQYTKDPTTGQIRGLGLGVVAIEVAKALAVRLGVELVLVEEPSPQKAIGCLDDGGCDLAFLGIEAERLSEVDFTPAVVQFDYTYLLPSRSAIHAVADVDRPGVRIVTVRGHAAALALGKSIKHAEIATADLPETAFASMRAGTADAFALPREVLLYYAGKLPGSYVLEGGYGVNRTGIAIAKNHPERLAYLRAFVEEVKASGAIQQVIDRNGMRGFQVATPAR